MARGIRHLAGIVGPGVLLVALMGWPGDATANPASAAACGKLTDGSGLYKFECLAYTNTSFGSKCNSISSSKDVERAFCYLMAEPR